jgi:hypothetical protein
LRRAAPRARRSVIIAAETIVEAKLREGKRIDEGEPPGEPMGDASTVRGGARAT